MTAIHDSGGDTRSNRWLDRLRRARLVLIVEGVVFAVLWESGALAATPTLAAFTIIAVAVLVRAVSGETARRVLPRDNAPGLRVDDPLVEAVLGGMPDPVVALDRHGDVVALNARASAIAPALRRGEPVSLALRVPEVLNAIRRAVATGTSHRVEFFERVPVDRWHEAIVTPIALAGGAPAGLVLVTFHDLTPLRRVEEMRADFIANASHELRTPLAALAGFIETLQGSARDDAAARGRFLPIMQAQATRMARLIDDLLSLSRIEQKVHIHPDTTADLVMIVNEVTDGLLPLARERDVEIKIIDLTDSLDVMGDRDELIRVFENLIENALKYGASGKRVDITLSREPAMGEPRDALVSVRDYGPGIAPEHLPRLTERFYRVDIAESRAQGGTGLGLALVKHILNRHRGRLMIESTPGSGANFSVRLPMSTGHGSAQT